MSTVEEVVRSTLKEVLESKGTSGDIVLEEESPLADVGLDSLDWAVVVISLEQRLGVDPFSQQTEYDIPNTIREFIYFYVHSVTNANSQR